MGGMKDMDYYLIVHCFLLLFLVNIEGQKTDRTSALSHKFYEPINAYPCFRRMNGTHQIGCSTAFGGDVGVLHLIESGKEKEEEGLEWVLKKGPHAPYVVLVYFSSFRLDFLTKLNNPERVSGILLLEKEVERDSFSTDSQCPNEGYGMYNKSSQSYGHNWNPPGSSLLFLDWHFAVVFVRGLDQAKKLEDCFNTFNKPNADGSARDWPLCAGQLKVHMAAAVDTPTCVRRDALSSSVWNISPKSVCDPVGGVNIYTPLVSRSQAEPYEPKDGGSVIVIATRLDSSSMFDKLTPGADSSATGLTALLALVKQLQPLKEFLPNNEIENVYFLIFNGEAFDYIGSSRVVYDMMKDKFPMENKDNSTDRPALLRMKDIKYFIEVDQLAQYDDTSSNVYYVHRNWDSKEENTTTKVESLVQKLKAQAQSQRFSLVSVDSKDWNGLPPASLQSFLAVDPDLPGIVITNHDGKTFRNKYYNSILDDAKNIGYHNASTKGPTVLAISSLVAAIGRTVEQLILPNTTKSLIESDPDLIDEILQCYVKSARCPLFSKLRKSSVNVPDEPFSLYAGVAGRQLTPASGTTINVIAYFENNTIEQEEKKCKHDNEKPIFDYAWLDGKCYKTSMGFTGARSPAFDIEDYDWTSGKYSTWTESAWNSYSVRIFLKPSMAHDLFTLFCGLAVFILSSIVIYWVNGKAEIIFESRYEGYDPVPPHC